MMDNKIELVASRKNAIYHKRDSIDDKSHTITKHYSSNENTSIASTTSLSEFSSEKYSSTSSLSRSWKTSSKRNEIRAKLNRKKVSFAITVKVCLIPSRKEYRKIASDLWWTAVDYAEFKKDAYIEVSQCIEKNQCTVQEAMFSLYQPDDEDDDETQVITQREKVWLHSTLHSIFDMWTPSNLNNPLQSTLKSSPTSSSSSCSSALPSPTSKTIQSSEKNHIISSSVINIKDSITIDKICIQSAKDSSYTKSDHVIIGVDDHIV